MSEALSEDGEKCRICHACGKLISMYYPASGDGSLRIMRKHKTYEGAYCSGSYDPEDRRGPDAIA